jgi:hypothetical protein
MLAIYVFGAGQLPRRSFAGAAVPSYSIQEHNGPMRSQEFAAEKVKAVSDYIGTKLASGTFWECGSDLENDIDLYLPTSGNGSEYSDVYVQLAEIVLLDGKLDADSQERIDAILRSRSL